MIYSSWKLTYDPAGTPVVLVNYGDLLESDELDPALEKTVEVVSLVDAAAPFIRVGKNAVTSFSLRVLSFGATDLAARSAMLDAIITAQTATKKPLRIEVEGVTGYYWQWANATVKGFRPRRLLADTAPAVATQWDIVATTLTKTAVP
jgi:hypothetical protein